MLINDPENRNFESKIWSFWPIWGVIFDHFGGQKSRFLDFFKVVLKLFRKCLGIVFGIKRRTFACSFSSKGVFKWPRKSRFFVKFWSKISIFRVIYQPLELKIHPKVGPLRSKTMPKRFLNNSKTIFCHRCQPGQKCQFFGPFLGSKLCVWLVGTKKINPNNS